MTDEEIVQHLKISVGDDVMVLVAGERQFSFELEGDTFAYSTTDGAVWSPVTTGGPTIASIVWE